MSELKRGKGESEEDYIIIFVTFSWLVIEKYSLNLIQITTDENKTANVKNEKKKQLRLDLQKILFYHTLHIFPIELTPKSHGRTLIMLYNSKIYDILNHLFLLKI